MEEALTGRGRPSLKQLHDHHVLREAAIKWRYIGFNLLNDVTALDIIEANYKQNIERCCQEMFKKWLETHEDASWYQLIKALKRVELIHLASQIELLLGDDNAVSSTISNDQTNNIKLVTFEDLEVEFARTTNKIKQTLKNNHIDIMSLVEQLQTISAVKDKKVPLLDEDVFENVTTIEKLWKKLNRYWSIVDYDVLRIVLKLVRCKQADDILEEFLSRIDITIIKDVDLVLYYEAFESKGLVKPSLRIKVKIDNYTDCIKAEVEKVMSSKFNLEEYSLRFRGIKEGCIELVYEISNAMMEYFLQCKFTGNDMIYFAACTIISVYINDMELLIPPEIEMVCS